MYIGVTLLSAVSNATTPFAAKTWRLQGIYESIVKTPLRLSEPASMEVSEQTFLQLAQISGTQRGLVVLSEEGEPRQRPAHERLERRQGPNTCAMHKKPEEY